MATLKQLIKLADKALRGDSNDAEHDALHEIAEALKDIVRNPPSRSKKRKLDASDIATILAALRMFQNYYRDKDASFIYADWSEHFNANTEEPIEPLSSEDIDSLCEEINFGDVRF